MSRDELERLDSIHAAAKLASSVRVRAIAMWVAAVVILPAAGWVGAKLDTRVQVDTLSGKVDTLSGELAVLTAQQRDLVRSIDALTAGPGPGKPPGPIYQLQTQVRYAHRNAIRATAAAVALERERDRKAKLAAAVPLLQAFDRRVERDGMGPAAAADVVLSEIAVQP